MKDSSELTFQKLDETKPAPKVQLGQYVLRGFAGVLWFMNAFDVPFRLW